MSDNDSFKSVVLRPKASAELITKKAKDVTIQPAGIQHVALQIYNALCTGELTVGRFKQSDLHPTKADEKAIDWIFLIDTLNFSFWSGDSKENEAAPKWQVAHNGKVYTGYFALCAGVNRAIQEGIDLTNPVVFGSLEEEDILKIFRSETSVPIPMAKERVASLKEVARVLLEKYQGSFVNCVRACGQSAQELLDQVVSDFPCYRDQNPFEFSTVSFWKRAQILVGDIWACFEGKDLGTFHDIDSLTMFADYRIPQVLLHFGAIQYSEALLQTLRSEAEMKNGDRYEMEIRGISIRAVDLIKEEVRKLIENGKVDGANGQPRDLTTSDINSIMIDHFLWDYRRDHVQECDEYPYHRVRCIFY